jgi:hypothetical protein
MTTVSVRTLRLTCSEFYVDARLTEVEGRWLASVDALMEALQPFEA